MCPKKVIPRHNKPIQPFIDLPPPSFGYSLSLYCVILRERASRVSARDNVLCIVLFLTNARYMYNTEMCTAQLKEGGRTEGREHAGNEGYVAMPAAHVPSDEWIVSETQV